MAKKPAPKPPTDVAVLHSPTEDGQGARVLRFKEGTVYAGEVRPAKEGEPVTHGELVRLRPLQAGSPVCEVEVLYSPPASSPARSMDRPARVSNPSYRRNWNAVFGASAKKKPPAGGGDFSVN